jgi:catechol 2,3-dioxygenase-like lactoylglutathione lyase family enzyme
MERAVPILPAEDLAAAKAFYVDSLGFEVDFEESDDGRAGLLGIRRGSLYLTLDCPMDGHGREACAALHVEDADRYYDEWRKVAKRAPHSEPWGGRTFASSIPSATRGS